MCAEIVYHITDISVNKIINKCIKTKENEYITCNGNILNVQLDSDDKTDEMKSNENKKEEKNGNSTEYPSDCGCVEGEFDLL